MFIRNQQDSDMFLCMLNIKWLSFAPPIFDAKYNGINKCIQARNIPEKIRTGNQLQVAVLLTNVVVLKGMFSLWVEGASG